MTPGRNRGVGHLLRKRDLAFITQIGTGAGGTLVTVGSVVYPFPWLVYLGVALTMTSHAVAGIVEYHLVRTMEKQTIDLVLEAATCGFLDPSAGQIRCNIMRYRWIRGFQIRSWMGNYAKEERSLSWKYGMGIVGKAAMAKKIAWGSTELDALYSNPSLADAAGCEGINLFGLTESHFRATSNLRTIVAVPVLDDDDDVIAIICMDDPASQGNSWLYANKRKVEKFLLGLAGILANHYNKL